MKIGLLKIVLFSLFFLAFTATTQATAPLDVVINEIAWMGTETSYNDEWIELYNNTNPSISFEGWILKTTDDTPEINLSGTVPGKSFYLLERTDDTTVPAVTADQIYKGVLGNEGEHLKLFDNQGNLIDMVNCSEGWLAGDNSTKQTMERIDSNLPGTVPGNWQTGQNPGGTPKSKNSSPSKSAEMAEDGPPPAESHEGQPHRIYPSGIIINELLSSPIGADAEGEWIEIFNSNNFEVDLSDWQITDKVGSVVTYTLSPGTIISPFGFLVLYRPETKIVLNNDGDGISLFSPDGELFKTINYEKAPLGQSYALQDNSWSWTSTLTPGKTNVITRVEIKTKEETAEGEKTETIVYPSGILTNEILPSPEGPDAEEEWIEIFNQNEFEVNLSGWQLRDTTGRTKTYTFPQATIVSPQGFLVLSRPDSKITLNNDGDGLELLCPNGEIIDQVSYQRAPESQSYNRTETEWIWNDDLTPGASNSIPIKAGEKESKGTLEIPEKQIAGLGDLFPKSRSLFVPLIALTIAISSGIITLTLKKKLKSS